MPCPTQEQLEQFLNEALTELDVPAVAAHVDRCESCQAALDAISDSRVLPDEGSSDGSMSEALADSDEGVVIELIDRLRGLPEDTQVSADLVTGHGSQVADSTLELPGRLGNYELMKVVGEGATGRLYRALDLQLDRIVAVKTLKSELAAIPSARARFEREARACAALTHDHIVAVHQVDPGSDGEPPYIVMEFVAGGSLHDRIRGEKRADMHQCVEWIRQTAMALQAAHDAGIVHRDVKPSNLLIDAATDRLRVADFGLARLVESEESLTAEGMIAGTPAYMSPEQIVNPTGVTGLTDIYSLGVVLYEALTGELPFRGTVRMVLNQVMHEDPIPPGRLNDRIPRDIENVCLKAMSRERPLRYQTAHAFAEDLERWLDDRPVLARPIGPVRKLWRWARKNPRLAAGTALVFSVLAAGAVDWRAILTSDAETRRQAEQLRTLADQQAIAVEQQQLSMLQFARGLLYDVHGELAVDPTTLDVRIKLLESTVRALQSIPNTSAHHAEADQAIMAAQSQLGRSFLQQNRESEAGQCLTSAEQLARYRITTNSDGVPVDLRPVAVLTEVLLHQSDLEARRAESATDDDARSGCLARAQAYCDEAVSLSQTAMQATAQQTIGQSDRSEWLKVSRRHCAARQRLGDILERLDRANVAATEYIAALATLTGLEATFPDSPTLQRDMGVLHLKLATLAVASQRDPLEHFQKAYRRFSFVHHALPRPQSQEDLAFTCEQLVSSLLGREDYKEAARIAAEECELRRDLARQAPQDDWRRRQFGECSLRLGTIEGHSGNWDAAQEAVAGAIDQFQVLLQRNPPLLVDRVLQIEAELMLATRDLALNLETELVDIVKLGQMLSQVSDEASAAGDDDLSQRIDQLSAQWRELQQGE